MIPIQKCELHSNKGSMPQLQNFLSNICLHLLFETLRVILSYNVFYSQYKEKTLENMFKILITHPVLALEPH